MSDTQTVDAGGSPINNQAAPAVQPASTAPTHFVTPVATDAPKAPAATPAKEDPTRFEYHQSRAQKMENQLREAAPLIELGRKVAENQEIMAMLSGRTAPQATPAPTQHTDELTAPVKPQKPASYNDDDAINDPRSESYRYRIAKQDYTEQLAEYVIARDMKRQEAEQARERERVQREALAQSTATFKAQLMQQHGLSATEAEDMIDTLGDPRSVTPANLVKLYRVLQQDRKGPATPPVNMGPVPAAVLGGESTAPASEGEGFNSALRRWKT